jgi:hypothetical protein
MTVIFCHPELFSGSNDNSQTPFNKFLAKTNKADNLRGPFHVIQDSFSKKPTYFAWEFFSSGIVAQPASALAAQN